MDHLNKLYEMCCEELQQLQNNIANYLDSSNKAFHLVREHEMAIKNNTSVAVLAYDKFLTSLCNMLDLARKFNMHLCINGHEEEMTRTLFQAMDITDRCTSNVKENGIIDEHQILPTDATSPVETGKRICKSTTFLPAEESDFNSSNSYSVLNESSISLFYNRKDLSVYKAGDIINASVTYVYELESLRFYICDVDSVDMKQVVELKNMINLRQYTGLPLENEVFGLVQDDVILRAVRESWMSFVPKKDEKHSVYLLDFGEMVDMSATDIAYRLPKHMREVPAQAILCELVGISGRYKVKQCELQQCLKKLEFTRASFCVTKVNEGFLQLNFLDNNNANCTSATNMPTTSSGPSSKKNTNPFLSDTSLSIDDCEEAIPIHALPSKPQLNGNTTRLSNGLTQDEMDMLWEEPLNTSNAMIATMGYNPKDELRICRFYDPETGACFKGSNCRQEHTPFQPDGWTKDCLPASNIVDNHLPITKYSPGLIINITPTYIGRIDQFYAQINDLKTPAAPLIWNDDEVPQCLRLSKPPLLFELVRARYEDGMWYRARIVDCDEGRKLFKIFYVDYGNHQSVPLNQLAHCDRSAVYVPFQAVICHVADVRTDNTATPEQLNNGVKTLNALILNRSFDVKVVIHYEDLVVRFMGEHFNKIPKRLIAMGSAKPYRNENS